MAKKKNTPVANKKVTTKPVAEAKPAVKPTAQKPKATAQAAKPVAKQLQKANKPRNHKPKTVKVEKVTIAETKTTVGECYPRYITTPVATCECKVCGCEHKPWYKRLWAAIKETFGY